MARPILLAALFVIVDDAVIVRGGAVDGVALGRSHETIACLECHAAGDRAVAPAAIGEGGAHRRPEVLCFACHSGK